MLMSPPKYHEQDILTVPSDWESLYSMPWDKVFYHFQRTDTVFEDTARTDLAENDDYIQGVADLTSAHNHGIETNERIDKSYKYDNSAGRAVSGAGSDDEQQIVMSSSIDMSGDGTLMFLVDFNSASTYGHRWLWGEFIIASTTSIVVKSRAITVSAMSSGTLMVICTFETVSGDSVVTLYVNSTTSSGSSTITHPGTISLGNLLGNGSAGTINSSIADGCYAFAASSQVLTSTQISNLMTGRQDIVDVGVWTP